MKCMRALIGVILLIASTASIAADAAGSYFAVIVDNIGASETWYRETLGLTAGERMVEQGRYEIVNLRGQGLFVELLELADAKERPSGLVQGPFKAGILVDDLRSFVDSLPAGAGDPEIIEDEVNGLLLVQLRDPDGNVVQVMQLTR